MSATSTTPTVVLPKGTQLRRRDLGGAAPVVFEAAQGLTCLKPRVLAVLAYDGYAYTDVTAHDAAASGYQPFGATATTGSALLLGFDAAEAFPGTEITFYVWANEATTVRRRQLRTARVGGIRLGDVELAVLGRLRLVAAHPTQGRDRGADPQRADRGHDAGQRAAADAHPTDDRIAVLVAAARRQQPVRAAAEHRGDPAQHDDADADADRRGRGARRQRRQSRSSLHAEPNARPRGKSHPHHRPGDRRGDLDRGERLLRLRPARPALRPQPDDRRGALWRRHPWGHPDRERQQPIGERGRYRIPLRRRLRGKRRGQHAEDAAQPGHRYRRQRRDERDGRLRRRRRGDPRRRERARTVEHPGALPCGHRRRLRGVRDADREHRPRQGIPAAAPRLPGRARSPAW